MALIGAKNEPIEVTLADAADEGHDRRSLPAFDVAEDTIFRSRICVAVRPAILGSQLTLFNFR